MTDYTEYTAGVWWCVKSDHPGGPYSQHEKCPHCEREERRKMTDKNRIRLAEALGWRRVTLKTFGGDDSNVWESPEGVQCANSLPDPFTDANDDYAVLEWCRKQHRDGHQKFYPMGFRGMYGWAYHVGDYARAALKVLDK